MKWKGQSENACVKADSMIKFWNPSTGVSKLGSRSATQGPARDMWAPRKANNLTGKHFWGREAKLWMIFGENLGY